ncbi:MAG: lipid A deacylase LpxR family protein [Alphaproteobacteria bacterium]
MDGRCFRESAAPASRVPRPRAWPELGARVPGFIAAALILVSIAPGPALAQDNGTLTLEAENDFFAPITSTDRHYTNGLRIAWLSPKTDVPEWIADVSDLPSHFGVEDSVPVYRRVGVALAQNIFTPDDTARTDLIVNDRPYAGWLYLAVALNTYRETPGGAARQDTFQVDLGVVGPSALGQEVQNNYHDVINVGETRGWSHQLQDEPAIDIVFQRQWRTDTFPLAFGLQGDVIPHTIVSLGNVLTYAGAGATLRLGGPLPRDFGPPRIRPGLPGSESFETKDDVSWYGFIGFEGRAVGRNIFLDGNSFRDSHSVSKHYFVGDFQAGVAVVIGSVRVTYTHVLLSPEFKAQSNWDQFGALSLSWNM